MSKQSKEKETLSVTGDLSTFLNLSEKQTTSSVMPKEIIPPLEALSRVVLKNRRKKDRRKDDDNVIHVNGTNGAALEIVPEPRKAVAQSPQRNNEKNMRMPDLGVLNQFFNDDKIHDILVNGTHGIYIDVNGRLEDSGVHFASEEDIMRVAQNIMDAVGQYWTEDRQMIDTRLPDGSRVNIVAPPMAVDGVSISIRKFPKMEITLEYMLKHGLISKELSSFLAMIAEKHLNIIVAGGTGSGKTTLLNAISLHIAPHERIVTIEDSAELRLQQPHVVRLEARRPLAHDRQHTAVTIRDLVKNALRMRPDRIIVGESRGAEAFDMLQAMNTGHDGSMTTLHANTPRDALSRLEIMVSMGMPQLPARAIRQQIANTVHLIIQLTRGKCGTRRVTHISEIAGMEGDTIMMQDLIVYHEGRDKRAGEYRWVGTAPRDPSVVEAARASGILRGGSR